MAPYPWFGGKSHAAEQVWAALGDVTSYVEPFCGSAAVLLARGAPGRVETINDTDGLLINAWRAIRWAPEVVAEHADWPISELDLTARHLWLVEHHAEIRDRLARDPDYYEPRAAAWWVWGACCWIGSGWCSGEGPWVRDGDRLVCGDAGRGIHRQLPHVAAGRGIHSSRGGALAEWFGELAARLGRVRICCGDWRRVVTPTVLSPIRCASVGVLLDPPYPVGEIGEYAGGSASVWPEVCAWAAEHGEEYRIVLCGYDGTWTPAAGWTTRLWRHRGGYQGAELRERLWCSPLCLDERQGALFGTP